MSTTAFMKKHSVWLGPVGFFLGWVFFFALCAFAFKADEDRCNAEQASTQQLLKSIPPENSHTQGNYSWIRIHKDVPEKEIKKIGAAQLAHFQAKHPEWIVSQFHVLTEFGVLDNPRLVAIDIVHQPINR